MPFNVKTMRQILLLAFLVLLFSCNNKKSQTNESATQKLSKEKTEIAVVFNNSIDSSVYQVKDYLLKKAIKKPETYKPLSWGKIEVLNSPGSKFRVTHKFICSDFELDQQHSGEKEYDVVFHLDSVGKVVAMCQNSDYLKYYSKEGLLCLYSSFEFEKIALDNRLDQLYKKDNSRAISIVSASSPVFTGKIGMTKGEFQKINFIKLSVDILKDIDTIDYCVDMSAEECRLYIFRNDTLIEIKTVLE
jgi:hypothetical protein